MDAAVWVGLTKPETRGKVLSADLVLTGSRWFEQQRDGTNLTITEATQARSVRAGCAAVAPPVLTESRKAQITIQLQMRYEQKVSKQRFFE